MLRAILIWLGLAVAPASTRIGGATEDARSQEAAGSTATTSALPASGTFPPAKVPAEEAVQPPVVRLEESAQPLLHARLDAVEVRAGGLIVRVTAIWLAVADLELRREEVRVLARVVPADKRAAEAFSIGRGEGPLQLWSVAASRRTLWTSPDGDGELRRVRTPGQARVISSNLARW